MLLLLVLLYSPMTHDSVYTVTVIINHRQNQDFVLGALFFPQKFKTFFQSSLSKHTLKLPKLPLPPPKSSPIFSKIGLLLCLGGALSVWGTLANFPYKYGPKFFSPPWGCTCTQCTPGYAYAINYII